MVLFRIIITILFIILIRISTTDETILQAMENAHNIKQQQSFEKQYRDALRACNIELPNE